MVGHTHEKVDGWHVHLRAFMLGPLKCMTGAVVALPAQLLKAMNWTGPNTIWNRKSKRCQWAGHLNHVWNFGEYFEGKTTVVNDRFIGGFKKTKNFNKIAETHEFYIFKCNGRTCFKYRTRQDLAKMSEGGLAQDFWRTALGHADGIPVFKIDADWSQPPKLGGFKEGWHKATGKRGEKAKVNYGADMVRLMKLRLIKYSPRLIYG